MTVMPFFKNLGRPLPVRDLLAESLKMSARLTDRWVGQILQRLEAGQ